LGEIFTVHFSQPPKNKKNKKKFNYIYSQRRWKLRHNLKSND